MIGYLKVNNLRYAVYATPKFGSCQFLIKPESLEAAIYAEGIDTSKVQTLMSAFEDDWHFCKYRADIAPGKIDTTLGNKELAVALAIAFNAAKKAVQKKHSQLNDGSYHSVWCEQIATSDKLESKMYFSLGLVSSFWLRTPYLELFVKDENLNLEIGTPEDFYTYHMHELRDECNKYPMFKSLSSEALKLYTLTQHYSTSSEYLATLLPKRSGYRAIKLSSAMKFPGASELSFEVRSKEIATDVYSTIRQVRAAHPDKSTDWIEQCNYVMVTDENLPEIMKSLWAAPIISFDTETTGLKINFMSREGLADELVGVCLSDKVGTGYYFPLQHKLFKNLCDGDHRYFMLTYMKELLEKKPIVCHNLSYDWKVAYIYDINVNCVFDTMIAFGVTKRYEYIGFQTGLKALCSMLFHIDMFEIADFVIGKWDGSSVTFADLPYELVAHYGPADADITLRLYYWCLQNKLLETYNAQRVFDLEVNFAKVVAYSEFWGYHIDVAQLPALEKDILDGMHTEQSELYRIAGKEFNANSSKQLQQIMYEDLKMPPMDDKKSTAKEILGAYAKQTDSDGNPLYPFAYHLLEYRKYESVYKNFLKKKDNYISPDGYVFAEVQQLGTNTGRVSIKEPNYQSYNDVVKQRVTGRPGYYIFDCDFAQIEYRVLASMAGQEALIKAFDDPDLDYHTHQAARMFSVPYAAVSKKLRQQSKGINFGLPYGMGDESLGKRVFGTKSPENTAKAADLRKRFFEGQEKIQDFFTRVRENGVRNGYTETWLGRRRYYHKTVFSDGAIRRQAGNHVIQGCLSGDVRIQTKEYGIVRISSVAGQALHVWDGKDWTRGIVTNSGLKQECIIHFTNGQEIHCSPTHKFAVVSHRGNVRFVDCQDLKGVTSNGRSQAHRVAITSNYVPSDSKYTSEAYYDMHSDALNASKVHLDDIKDSFGMGVVLGRLASDGHFVYSDEEQRYYLEQCVAEHEYSILPELMGYMEKLNANMHSYPLRAGRNECLTRITAYSKTLISEVRDLDVRHKIADEMFADTELLRGFLRGMFDGDGGISGESIILTQGVQDNFETLCRDIQKAMLFFGIRVRYRYYEGDRYALQVTKADIPRFLDLIGFMSPDKQEKASNIMATFDQHTFGKCLVVDYVEKTENFIPMYDVCDTERGYFVADGIVTHNSAADIWKTAVVRFFNRVVKEGWLGKVLFDGFIHDELMGECSVDIDPYEFIKAWREEYELSINKFCKLYAGFGWGNSWYEAKKADYPPYFISQIIAKGSQPHTWDGDYKTLIKQTKEELYQYEIKRVVDWVKEQKTGTIIAPHINAYLYDKMSDFWSDIVAKHPELENSSLKKLSLDEILVLFAEHEGFEYTPGTILAPDAVKPVETKAAGTVEEAELTEEQLKQLQMNKQQQICQNVLNFGFMLDSGDMVLYLKYTGEPVRQMFENTYCSELAKSDIRVVYLIFNPDQTVSAMSSSRGIAMSDLNAVNNFIRGVIMHG